MIQHSLALSAARGALLTVVALLVPAWAAACPPPDPARVRDDALVAYSDGSFENASADDRWSTLRGRPVRDIGGGRVGQIIEYEQCGTAQYLLFVDCTTGSAISVGGLWTGEPGEAVSTSTSLLQPPHGPLALTGSTTVAEVDALAVQQAWHVERDVLAWAAARGPRNMFNPFLGCRIFYPGSVGAMR
jgi:hypothetical protein